MEFVHAGLAFTERLVENMRWMNAYWQKPDEELAAKVRANWDTMQRLAEEHPYAINWGPVRPSTPRMIGLHPDYPNPKWRPKPPAGLDLN